MCVVYASESQLCEIYLMAKDISHIIINDWEMQSFVHICKVFLILEMT